MHDRRNGNENGGHGGLTRRRLLRAAAATGLGAATPLSALAREVGGPRPQPGGGYGELMPVADESTGLYLLELPEGFRYTSFGWTGDPLADGTPTPPSHDGMGAFASGPGRVRLVRNHEETHDDGVFAPGLPVYDPAAAGGTTTLEFDSESGRLLRAWGSLSGTLANCAGGPTPWGAWLSCEESLRGPGHEKAPELQRPHGYVFEVPADGRASAEPLRAMGRFAHEAVAIDPASGIAYMTEDEHKAGFYRFVPDEPRRLAAGGKLQMLAVKGRDRYDARKDQRAGAALPVTWVDIRDPDPEHPEKHSVFQYGREAGGATFRRLEGAFYGNGRVYFVSTSGGNAECGQVWSYEPAAERLTLVFESPHRAVLDYPDNVVLSPRGGLLLCEDGENTEFLHGLTLDGQLYRFCQNRVVLTGQRNGIYGDFTNAEFCGACFDPSGHWLFVNIQKPGLTFAITGPWPRGTL